MTATSRPLLDEAVRQLWLSSASMGQPPEPRMVAELEYGLSSSWHLEEAFFSLAALIDPSSPRKSLVCREASRGSGKSVAVAFIVLYLTEWVLPFLARPHGLPILAANRVIAVLGRDQAHLRNEVMKPIRDLIIQSAPWLRSPDWLDFIEDPDSPNNEGVRELDDLKSRGSSKWENLRLDCANGVSIRTRTLRQSIRGFHVFAILMDDPLTESNVSESPAIKSLIQGAVLPALEPGGLFLLAGTPQQPGDLFDLCRLDSDWNYKAYPAYDEDGSLGYAARNLTHLGQTAFDLLPVVDQHCLWPIRLNYAVLEQAKGSTPESVAKFEREYMLKRISETTALVKYDDILTARDTNLSYHHTWLKGFTYRGGIDPSRLKRDEAGLCVGYVTPDGVKIPANLSAVAVAPHLPLGHAELRIVQELNDLATRYHCYDWKVESNGLQSAIAPLAQHVNASIRFSGFHLSSNKHTENGWVGLRTLFQSRKVKLPYATESDRRTSDAFTHQLQGLRVIDGEIVEDPTRHNDLVSAFFLWAKNMEDVAPSYAVTALVSSDTKDPLAISLPGSQSPRPQPFQQASRGGELSRHQAPPTSVEDSITRRVSRWQRR